MDDCDICFKIICKICLWEANDIEISAIQDGIMKNCPKCGWSPREIEPN